MLLKFEPAASVGNIHEIVGGRVLGAVPDALLITGFSADSRKVTEGSGFLAYRGVQVDAHKFIPGALKKGAALLIVEDEGSVPDGIPAIVVDNARNALSALASTVNGNPTDDLLTIGITGTNGKTTTQWLISEVLESFDHSVLRVGTLGVSHKGEIVSKGETTTPTCEAIHTAARDAKAHGATALVMETSSHALCQSRVDHVAFDGAIFTNLTPDHLDYHPDVEDYFQAKLQLFELVKKLQRSIPLIIGVDDEYGKRAAEWCSSEGLSRLTFGVSEDADVVITDQVLTASGISFRLREKGSETEITAPLIGWYNVLNVVASYLLLRELGYDPEKLQEIFSNIAPPPGRMERFAVATGEGTASIFVDYAHAPQALRSALQALRPITDGRLWVLFGCGGDRDPRRRTGMGEAAKELADKIVVTSDNPRSESPEKIIEDILETGLDAESVEVDRRKAIHEAIPKLATGDVLLVAGKGHEDYQIIGDSVEHFSDREEVEKAIAKGE